MSSRLRRGLIAAVAVIALMLVSVIAYAGSVTYTYDSLNRLIKAEYEDGTVIQYTYDADGNRTALYSNITPPVTTPSLPGGNYGSAQSVSLTCTDLSGSGCDKIYYTTDGSTPTTSSPVYSSPINMLVTTVLKFMAKDLAGNTGSVQSQTYTISYGGCANPPVKIGSTFYLTPQAAYDAAGDGSTIRCRGAQFIGNLTVNRNITVTLEGGYDCGYTTDFGTLTPIKGMITTTSGGGTMTIKNFVLEK